VVSVRELPREIVRNFVTSGKPDNLETSLLCDEGTGVFQQRRFRVRFVPHGQTTRYRQRIEIRKVVTVKSLKT
jgi:hypothetical protein